MKSTKNIFLILASMSFILVLGAATYEHLGVVPQWSAAPPSSLAMFQGEYGLKAENFWIPIHPVTFLLMVGALIANWKTPRRNNILTVLIGYVIILASTFIYFVPELLDITQTPYQENVDQVLVDRASMWETLSLVRLVFIAVLAYILLSALTKATEIVVVPKATAVPLNYQNDSLGG